MKIAGVVFAGEYYIEHNQNGIDTLGFDIYPTENAYRYCKVNEIIDNGQLYKIMQIDDNGTYLSVSCTLNLDSLKEKFYKNLILTNKTLNEILVEMYTPLWSIENAIRSDRRTLELTNINSFSVLSECQKQFECYFAFDNLNKIIKVIYLDEQYYDGNYLSVQLNTLTTEYTSDSYQLANRIYPIGKNGLSIASVNNGLEYVENLQFNPEPISASIVDEKITNPNDLKSLGLYILNERCKPKESYKFKIANLSKLNKNDFSLKNLKVHSIVKYLDKDREREVFHIVTKYKEFPLNPHKDEITLSSEITNISSTVSGSVNTINTNIENSFLRAYNNATSYTDDALIPINESITTLKTDVTLLKTKVVGYTGNIDINGQSWRFENGILKSI